jgi:hypothetical protein
VTGTLLVGGAWAGVGLAPTGSTVDLEGPDLPVAAPAAVAAAEQIGESGKFVPGPQLPAGQFLVGADVQSIVPVKQEDGGQWQTQGCAEYDNEHFGAGVEHLAGNLANLPDPPGWPKSPDCIYLGGYGIGPARAATGADPVSGVSVRSLAISNGKDVAVWQMIDMVGYFNKFRADLCEGCGILDMRRAIAAEAGIPEDNVAIGSTHTHGGADGYGAWGGLPTWYREFVRDQVLASARAALGAMTPAALEVGQVDARDFNSERRDTYYSTPDYGAVWLQARALPWRSNGRGRVIATLVNFAAHPTVLGSQPLMHGDWPATASKALADTVGGTGLIFEGGLGNVSDRTPRGPQGDFTGDGAVDDYDSVIQVGKDFAAFITADIKRGGKRLDANDIVAKTETIEHPVTNWAEAGLGVAGLLDREFMPGEAAGVGGTWAKPGKPGASDARSCTAAAPNTIKTQVSGYRIGDLMVLTAPGEIFSNISEVVKSYGRRNAINGAQTMVFGQTQDSLGYIIQSFEVDPVGGVLTNVDGGTAEYEETFMLDRCFGDHVVQTQVGLIGSVLN